MNGPAKNSGKRPQCSWRTWDAGALIHEGAPSSDDIDRIAQVELQDMAGREVRVANDGLVPSTVLLREVARAPVKGEGVDEQPADQSH